MKIESISFRLENLKLTKPYRIAFKTVDFVENLFCMIRFTNGIVGFGACNPENEVAFVSRDKTINTIDLVDQDLLKSKSYDDPWELIYTLNKMIGSVPTLQVALEIAVWDAWGKKENKSVLDLWGKKSNVLSTSVTIGIMDVEQTINEAEEFLKNGFDHLKVKIGLDPEQDIERLVKLRETFHDQIHIRSDINQGYRLEDVKKYFSLIKDLDIELHEQPLRRDQFHELDTLDTDHKKFIAADESLLHLDDAKEIVSHKRCGIFNIKLMKCGGWSRTQKIADLGLENNIKLMWGCNDESRLSITAGLHMAYACENTRYLDLDGSFDLAYDPAIGGFTVERGKLIPKNEPGFAIQLDF